MIIQSGNINIEINDNLPELDHYSDQHFIHFEMKNFLQPDVYLSLLKEVHSLDDFDFVFTNQGEKRKRSVTGNNVSKLNKGVFKNFCRALLSRDFYKWFVKTHLPHFPSQSKICVYISNPSGLIFRISRKIRSLLHLPVYFFHTEIEYSSIQRGGYIPPHTDAKTKRLSFVYYLPEKESRLTEKMKKSLGTVFWKPKKQAKNPLRRFNCSLLDGAELTSFYRDYEPLHISKYEPNKITGFIKSDNSWHSVETIGVVYDRRAIVINIYET